MIFTFQMSIIAICVSVIVLYVVSSNRDWLKKVDLYNKQHNHFVGEPMYVRGTSLGGLFSVLFILVALILVFTTLITYSLNNIEESKALVPMVTLDEDFDKVMTS
jgi:esterase/lipase